MLKMQVCANQLSPSVVTCAIHCNVILVNKVMHLPRIQQQQV